MTERAWNRVSVNSRCPVCSKPDWCLVSADRSAVICPRIPSERYIDGSGYLHILKAMDNNWKRDMLLWRREPEALPEVNSIMERIVVGHRASLTEPMAWSLSRDLGVSEQSLHDLDAGWSETKNAMVFPMCRIGRRVIGIRFRGVDGSKWSMKESRAGLFIPRSLDRHKWCFIVEGPTDTAAVLTLGLNAIGLPSSCSPYRIVAEAILGMRVCFVFDHDGRDHQATDHMTRLAIKVAPFTAQTVVSVCPSKDVRQWVADGAGKQELIHMCRSADAVEVDGDLAGMTDEQKRDAIIDLLYEPEGGIRPDDRAFVSSYDDGTYDGDAIDKHGRLVSATTGLP